MKLACYFLLLLGLACATSLPGEVDAGLFEFSASTALGAEDCKPDMTLEGSLPFEGRFRLESNLVDGYFIYRNIHRTAQFDGQKMVSAYETEHGFLDGCEACNLRVIETLDVVLLSETQNEVLNNQCPCHASSEGIPVDEGQNIFPPRPVPSGFDAVRACGTLIARVLATPLPGQNCPENCHEDDTVYYIEGIRKE
jgi:hypothetical protein